MIKSGRSRKLLSKTRHPAIGRKRSTPSGSRGLNAFCSGVIGVPDHTWIEIVEAETVTKKGVTQLHPT